MDRQRLALERRQTQRRMVESLTYINLEPGNGGMILNISEGGLGLCAAISLQKSGMIHFRLSEPDLQIEADAEVAWTDETRRKGGLRFTNLSPETRRQIHGWINRPTTGRWCAPVARHGSASAESAAPVTSSPAAAFCKNRLRSSLQGFSGGLVSGLLLSALVGGALLLHSRHRELGEVLVRWGERLGAERPPTRSVQTHTRSLKEQVESSAASPAPDLQTKPREPMAQTVLRAPNPVKRESDTAPKVAIRPSDRPPVIMSSVREADRKEAPLTMEARSLAVLPERLLATPAAPNVLAELPAPMAPEGLAGSTSNTSYLETHRGAGSAPLPERYLEIGKFKDKTPAEQVKEHVAQLGLPTILAQRRRLWMNSYYVLVGPYGEDREIESARTELVSRGFPARSYEKGSRNMTFPSGLMLKGASLPCGSCTISWEAYEPNASIKIQTERGGFVQAEGKLLKRNLWYDHNEFFCRISPDGSRNLLEIRLASTNQALVFERTH